MKIQHKFALFMFSSIAVFLLVFSLLSYWYNRGTAVETAQELMKLSVEEKSNTLGNLLIEKSKLAISIASSDTLLLELGKSNLNYEKLTEDKRNTLIDSLNSKWIKTSSTDDPFIKSYMHNPVADLFNLHKQALPDEVGEIFITNRYGLAIGTTNKLSTLAHSHKYWWKEANNNGQGKIFLDDRGYDKSVGDYVIGIVIPIKKNDQVIGILKCNFKLLETLKYYITPANAQGFDNGLPPNRKILLARSSGRIILGNNEEPLRTSLPDFILKTLNPSSAGSILGSINGIESIISYSPVRLTFSSENYGFGGRYIDNRTVRSHDKTGWYLLNAENLETVLSPTINRTKMFIYDGLLLALAAGIIALMIGRNISRPVRILTEYAKRVGKGQIDAITDVNLTDELGTLTQAFNKMGNDLKISQNELIKKERLATLGQLTATVSHEIRNPLSAMYSAIYIIKNKSDTSDTQVQKATQLIERNIGRCDHIIDELLDFTRNSKLDYQTILLDEWLESIIDEQKIPQNIQIQTAFSLKDVKVVVDSSRLRRAIINIIENACHAMTSNIEKPEPGTTACLGIATANNNNRIEITITDTGTGMPQEIVDKIFEPLYSTKSFGVGLGMPSVKQTMEQHGGGIEIKTSEGHGTAMTLWLPVTALQGNTQ